MDQGGGGDWTFLRMVIGMRNVGLEIVFLRQTLRGGPKLC